MPQSEFFTSDAKATAMVCGFGTGKTVAAAARMITTKFQYPTVNLLYGAPTYGLIRDILFPEFEELMTKQGFVRDKDYFIKSHDIVFPGHGKILCRTLDNPNNLIGFQVGDAFLDEFDTMTSQKARDVWVKVLARARKAFPDGKQNQLYISTTPEGYKETYRLFVKEKPHNYRLIKAATQSNPHLPEDYVETLRAVYPTQLIDAYLDGEFVNLTSGAVYPQFDRLLNDTKYVERPRETLHIGMDFNVYRMAAVVHVIRDNKAHAVGELIKIQDTPSMCTAIKERYSDHPIIVYPDSSGHHADTRGGASLSDIRILQKAGFRVDASPANPRIKNRVNSVNARLCDGKNERHYFVNVEKCPNTTLCFEQQAYDDNGLPEKNGESDHPMDAAGYFVYRRWPLDGYRILRAAGNYK